MGALTVTRDLLEDANPWLEGQLARWARLHMPEAVVAAAVKVPTMIPGPDGEPVPSPEVLEAIRRFNRPGGLPRGI